MMDAIPGTYSTDAPSRFTLLHPLCGGAYNLPMRRLTGFVLLLSVALIASPQAQVRPAWLDPYRENADKLIKAATGDQFAWDRVAELTDTYGQRISGSENLNRAIACYYQYPDHWRHLMLNAMRTDYSWNHPGQDYLNIYDYIRAK